MSEPSSYRDSLDSVASRILTNLVIIPWDMAANVFSIMSSIFLWYLCYNEHNKQVNFSDVMNV